MAFDIAVGGRTLVSPSPIDPRTPVSGGRHERHAGPKSSLIGRDQGPVDNPKTTATLPGLASSDEVFEPRNPGTKISSPAASGSRTFGIPARRVEAPPIGSHGRASDREIESECRTRQAERS